MDRYELALERLADLEHEQWMKWAKTLMKTENLSLNRIARWEKYMVPYSELDAKTKGYDRRWAKKVFDVINDYLFIEKFQSSLGSVKE